MYESSERGQTLMHSAKVQQQLRSAALLPADNRSDTSFNKCDREWRRKS